MLCPCFALTASPIVGTGSDEVHSGGIRSNTNDYFWRAVMTLNRFALGVLSFALFPSAVPSLGQQTLGSLNGTVLDASGAAVPQATVTATSAGTDLERSTKTGSTGFWQILDLPIGNYKVDRK